eukprot:gene23117-27478_t
MGHAGGAQNCDIMRKICILLSICRPSVRVAPMAGIASEDGGVIALGLFQVGHQLPCRQGFAVVVALTLVATLGDDV